MIAYSEGMLFGIALGDALGRPVEFMTLDAIKARYGREGIQDLPDPALYTDDTEMTICLTEALLAVDQSASLDEKISTIARHFVLWSHTDGSGRARGLASLKGTERFESGLPWSESGLLDGKGCGSVMRVAPIGYLYQDHLEQLQAMAAAQSQITHNDPSAIASSVAGAYLIHLARSPLAPSRYLAALSEFVSGMSDELEQVLRRVGHVISWGSQEKALTHIGEGWIGTEAVGLALYCVMKYPDDVVSCMRRAANITGDSDSIASIAGGILGARLGIDSFPSDWVKAVENSPYLHQLAHRLESLRLTIQ